MIRVQLLARTANAATYEFNLGCGERKVLGGTALVAFVRMQEVSSVRPIAGSGIG